ncbi:MAG: ABC transporter permease [Actinobacteria bacterium]|nr:ABC transporter permease [Actinomycetota bacterium]
MSSLSTSPNDLSLTERVRVSWPILRRWVVREHKTRYRQSILNVLWAVVTPLGLLAIYGVILTHSANVTGEGVPYLTFAWTGLVIWQAFASGLNTAAPSLVSSADVLSKIWFPREVIPMAATSAAGVDLAFGLTTLVVLALVQGVRPTMAVFTVVIPLLILVTWSLALGIVMAVVNAFVRDVGHGIRLALQIGFFATPVVYGVGFLEGIPLLVEINPLAAAIEGVRDSLLRGAVPDRPWYLAHLAAGCLALVAALWYARAVEHRIADVI